MILAGKDTQLAHYLMQAVLVKWVEVCDTAKKTVARILWWVERDDRSVRSNIMCWELYHVSGAISHVSGAISHVSGATSCVGINNIRWQEQYHVLGAISCVESNIMCQE